MSKRRRYKSKNDDLVVMLAYFHRYGYFALMLVLIYTLHVDVTFLIGSMMAIDGLYTIIGTKLGFRHLYCSMQNANHQKMTPSVRRYELTRGMKEDLYGIGGIFTFLGLALLVVRLYFPGH